MFISEQLRWQGVSDSTALLSEMFGFEQLGYSLLADAP